MNLFKFSIFIDNSGVRPVFNCPLMDHLRVTKRKIAFPIELCVCAIMEHGICEEGLFRVAGGKQIQLILDCIKSGFQIDKIISEIAALC